MFRYLLYSVLLALTLSSCGNYDQILKSKDVTYKFKKANEFYDKGKWEQATQLYESLLPVFRGTKNYEELYYRYAYSFYNAKDYVNAAYQFKNFTDYFPKSERAEEMEFMYAVSLYKDSLRPSLDQTSTIKALAAMQSYISVNASTKRAAEANNYIDLAYRKLETKAERAAKLYYDIGQYNASAIAYKTMIFDFPDSKEQDYYYYMILKSSYQYARNSYESKQEERYAEVLSTYETLKSYYPKSTFLVQSGDMLANSSSQINKLRNATKK